MALINFSGEIESMPIIPLPSEERLRELLYGHNYNNLSCTVSETTNSAGVEVSTYTFEYDLSGLESDLSGDTTILTEIEDLSDLYKANSFRDLAALPGPSAGSLPTIDQLIEAQKFIYMPFDGAVRLTAAGTELPNGLTLGDDALVITPLISRNNFWMNYHPHDSNFLTTIVLTGFDTTAKRPSATDTTLDEWLNRCIGDVPEAYISFLHNRDTGATTDLATMQAWYITQFKAGGNDFYIPSWGGDEICHMEPKSSGTPDTLKVEMSFVFSMEYPMVSVYHSTEHKTKASNFGTAAAAEFFMFRQRLNDQNDSFRPMAGHPLIAFFMAADQAEGDASALYSYSASFLKTGRVDVWDLELTDTGKYDEGAGDYFIDPEASPNIIRLMGQIPSGTVIHDELQTVLDAMSPGHGTSTLDIYNPDSVKLYLKIPETEWGTDSTFSLHEGFNSSEEYLELTGTDFSINLICKVEDETHTTLTLHYGSTDGPIVRKFEVKVLPFKQMELKFWEVHATDSAGTAVQGDGSFAESALYFSNLFMGRQANLWFYPKMNGTILFDTITLTDQLANLIFYKVENGVSGAGYSPELLDIRGNRDTAVPINVFYVHNYEATNSSTLNIHASGLSFNQATSSAYGMIIEETNIDPFNLPGLFPHELAHTIIGMKYGSADPIQMHFLHTDDGKKFGDQNLPNNVMHYSLTDIHPVSNYRFTWLQGKALNDAV